MLTLMLLVAPLVAAQAPAAFASERAVYRERLALDRALRREAVATVWLRPTAGTGRVDLDPLRSAVVSGDGARRSIGLGAVRWAR